jgi:small subunit ribosomal protein S15
MVSKIKDFLKPFQRHEKDNGSPEVQTAILSDEIKTLQDHIKLH